jgi:hypothetical protein
MVAYYLMVSNEKLLLKMPEVSPGGTFTYRITYPARPVSVRHTTTLFSSYPEEPLLTCVSRFPFLFCEKIKGEKSSFHEEPIPVLTLFE